MEINNTKYVFLTSDYEIVLEDVKNLGLFLEVEKLRVSDKANVLKITDKIWSFIESLNLKTSEELNAGKQELMLLKQKNLKYI